jgi:hypothetical protein
MKADLIADNEINLRSPYGGGNGAPGRGDPAKIIPFPMAARVAFLERMAASVACCRDPQAYLDRAAKQQREAMQRRQLSEKTIEQEISAFYQEVIERVSS